MSATRGALTAATLLLAAACGGAPAKTPSESPPATPPPAGPAAAPSPAAPSEPSVRSSDVRFDDLGLSIVVPPGYRATPDAEIDARVRASTSARTIDLLRNRPNRKKGYPLLILEREGATETSWLTVTVTAIEVPAGSTPEEILQEQRTVMQSHLEGFSVVEPASAVPAGGGAKGAKLTSRYVVKGKRNVDSELRVYVRAGIAFMVAALRGPEMPGGSEQTEAFMSGIRFYDPKP